MEDQTHYIAIISDQILRAESLSKTIENGLKRNLEIPVFKTDKLQELNSLPKPLLIIIDLMGTGKNYKQIITPIREIDSSIKIIALHLYRSSFLVNPLFKMGINGYVYYEPSREELVNAIQTVQTGKTYIPSYLLSA